MMASGVAIPAFSKASKEESNELFMILPILLASIVCGCDTPRQFILSGFQSLKALSPEPCRPFDMERMGLNLGEAAATLILSK